MGDLKGTLLKAQYQPGSGFQQLNRRTTIEIPHDEAEDSALGPATFNVTSTQKWAVGNAGSLRYYGLGLQNGPYTVTLQFAETGNLRRKDFDISKEVGGVNRAVPRPFKVNVTENYLDILLFWAVLYMRRKTSEKDDDEGKRAMSILLRVNSACGSRFFLVLISVFERKYFRCVVSKFKPMSHSLLNAELRAATEDFNPSNKLGEGGYGPVYKGTLSDGRVVAVKQLSVASHQGKSQFVTEIAMISAVQHRNLVKLYGCCIEGSHRILIYEYLENKSLDQALFGRNDLHLNWPTCFNILLGTARGLAYLHEESMPRIIRRDVKASNILLDAELSPKISDFGWAKLYDDEKTHMRTRVAHTIGYLAPEYAMRGHLTEKADVFGFGVVALEISAGDQILTTTWILRRFIFLNG
ncbi:Leucine-rich repeat transmembrane protein kinase [Prunus dulcis]|uniref:non-specific serine/threonine protein kinase n=1 Tax=Prunus dulcis TaxID=3755 RepID=A0A4Y1RCL8_PRUDU|nr:Leucine-rich repeat transmembrane protein kinase [Prunus dulcis]